nr:response regulator [Rhizobium wenxiniae]
MRWLVHSDPVTVLVVEDEALIRLAIVDELGIAGFQVYEADGAEAAIAIIERHAEIRMIFTDIDMHGTMDGLKLAAFVRDRWPPIKIIVTSGRVIPAPNELPSGVPFLAKPYDFDLVVTSIRNAMNE